MKRLFLRHITLLLLLLAQPLTLMADGGIPNYVRDSITVAFQRITLPEVAGCYAKIEQIRLRERGTERVVEVRASKELAYYPMRRESVQHFYDEVRRLLPKEYRNHTILIYTDGELIDRLVPQYYRSYNSAAHFKSSESTPLITRQSAISQPDRGLTKRHIALWQSHGRYFDNSMAEWRWQRSRLWETVEDLYTQSYVVPYLLPMLERAGAVVLLPRERSMRREEVILDNDAPKSKSHYSESTRGESFSDAGVGFAHLYDTYTTGHNPFEDGTVRQVATTTSTKQLSKATWGGSIPKSGVYTLYVAYRTMENSVSDARYTVHTAAGDRVYLVNQRMGGSMWVPLGEFYFEEGEHRELVTLDNHSSESGVVTADAIKIGGGMGNIARSVHSANRKSGVYYTSEVSGYPRFTEGARYWLQWSGFSEEVYAKKEGKDDYKDDLMSRPHWVNALMGGSTNLSEEEGKAIPIDLALAFHSDAGVRLNDDIIGTLGIYSTKENSGEFEDGASRLRSRDLTDIVMTEIVRDIRAKYEPNWTRRGMWDRAYYEARMTSCPTMLLELLSHQNFADMRYGLDPNFRFDVSRAIYKGVLRYLSSQYNTEYIVQPLPVNSFSAELRGEGVYLSWEPTIDELEPTATPDYYIVYTREGNKGFDAGRRVDATSVELQQEAGKIYSYRITAVNRGGESFDSETLSACRQPRSKGNVMVINGFDRVSAPLSIQGDSIAGFYNRYDSGVAYIEDISFIGEQVNFDRRLSRSENDNNALGQSYNDYESEVIAGNTFDYPALHGAAIVKAGYSFSSASRRAVESGRIALKEYAVVDVVMGKQRTTQIGRGAMGYNYQTFGEALKRELRNYTSQGGAIMLSGSYMLTDLWESPLATEDDKAFARDVLRVNFGGNMATRRGEVVATPSKFSKKDLSLTFNTELCEDIYCVESPEVVRPTGKQAYTALRYRSNGQSAAVAAEGKHRSFVMGFPYETILDETERNIVMERILKFLSDKK